MITAADLSFSDAELTLLARMLGHDEFPATAAPELDEAGWAAVERGLAARGTVADRFGPIGVADDVADVLAVVLGAERSLWTSLAYAPGAGQNRGFILWLGSDGAVVRQAAPASGAQVFAACGRQGVGDMLTALLDFPTAANCSGGETVTLATVDFAEAMQLATDDPDAATTAYPAIAGFIDAVTTPRCTPTLESHRTLGAGRELTELITFAESPEHGLWIAHDDATDGADLMTVTTRVQRVTTAMARDEATALVDGLG